MNRQELIDLVEESYRQLATNAHYYRRKAMEYVSKEHEINFERNRLLNSGVITGKNAEMREAEMQTALVDLYDELLGIEANRDLAYLQKEQSEIEVARVRAILRVLELSEEVLDEK